MEERFGEWEPIEIVLRQPPASQLSVKSDREGSRYQVQLKLGTRHKKYNLHTGGKDRSEITGYTTKSKVEVKHKI
jgi:hypothetical protein